MPGYLNRNWQEIWRNDSVNAYFSSTLFKNVCYRKTRFFLKNKPFLNIFNRFICYQHLMIVRFDNLVFGSLNFYWKYILALFILQCLGNEWGHRNLVESFRNIWITHLKILAWLKKIIKFSANNVNFEYFSSSYFHFFHIFFEHKPLLETQILHLIFTTNVEAFIT